MSLMAADPDAYKVMKKTTDTEKSAVKEVQHSIAHFLIDFEVVPYSVGFLIAFTFKDFMQALSARIMRYLAPLWKDNELSSTFLTLIVTFILCMLFVKYIFYSMFQNEDIKTETAVKDAVMETKKEIIKNKIANSQDKKQIINRMYD